MNFRILSCFSAIFLASLLQAANSDNGLTGSISIESTVAQPGDTVILAVTAEGFADIGAFDCYINFDDLVMDTIYIANTVINKHPSIAGAFHNVINGNTVAVSWFSSSPVSIPDGEKLFDLQLIFCNDLYTCALGGTNSPFTFDQNLTHFTTTDLVVIDLEYNNGSVYALSPLRALTVEQSGNGSVFVNNELYTEPIITDNNAVLTLEAVAEEGWEFSGWSGDINSTESTYELVMDTNKTVFAGFDEVFEDLFSVFFSITNENGAEVADAIIFFNDIEYEAGEYVFDEIEPGTYNYIVTHQCYPDAAGEIIIEDADVDLDIQLEIITGDANGDGEINVLDVITIAGKYIGIDPEPFCFYNADINQDGAVNIVDIILLIGLLR